MCDTKHNVEGTTEDGRTFFKRLDKLEEYGLSKWSSRLKNVLHEFGLMQKTEMLIKSFGGTLSRGLQSIGSGGDRVSY